MKISITIALGAALLAAAPGLAYASGNRAGNTNTNPNSASQFAPGQRQTTPGTAKQSAPGQRQTEPGTASQFAPGQKKQPTNTGNINPAR